MSKNSSTAQDPVRMESPVNMEVGDGEEVEEPLETKDNGTDTAVPIRTQNPFLIDHIVDNVVRNSCFTKSDKLNLRAISKAWNRSATKHLKVKLELRKDDNRIMTDAISLLENPDGNFNVLRRVEFHKDFFPSSDFGFNTEFHRTFGRFLSLISTQIESLYVCVDQLDDGMDFYESCYADELKFPKLKFPKLKSMDLVGNSSPFFFFLGKALLMASSRLHSLFFGNTSNYQDLNWSLDRNVFADMILKNLPASIRELFLISTFTPYDARIFSSVHLPNLTSLDLSIGCTNEVTGADVCNLFTNSINMTLTKLDFQINWINENTNQKLYDFKLPVFSSLTELGLHFCRRVLPSKDELLSFPQLFPKVRRFSFEDEYMESSSRRRCLAFFLFSPGFDAPEVRSCRWENTNLEEGEMQNLFRGFGSLNKLTIQVPETDYLSNIKFIFQFCPHLEELYLRFDATDEDITNLDSILTGIPEDVLANLNVLPDPDPERLKTQPGLSDLKNLKILGCEYSTRNGNPEPQHPVNITNKTVYFGIQQLPKFEKLLTGKEMPLSEDVLAELRLIFGENVIQQN